MQQSATQTDHIASAPAAGEQAKSLTEAVADCFLFDGTSEQERAACGCRAVAERSFARGQTVYDRSRAEPALVLVLEGRVRAMQGRVVMNELEAGQVFGAAALFAPADRPEPYRSAVVAATDCRLAFIPQEAVAEWMRISPQVSENYIRFLSGRIRFLNRRLATLTAGQADGRLWCYLLAHRAPDGTVVLPGGMSALAKALGIGRSSLYRSIDRLTEDGRIRRIGRQALFIPDPTQTDG